MCPRSKEENEKVRSQTSATLLQAALVVFAKKGYHSSSMAEIAEAAEVSKGLAYHYFKSKEDLLVSLAELRLQQWSPLIDGLESIEGADERLLFLINFVLDELVEKTDELRFYNALYLHADGVRAIEKAMKQFKGQFERFPIAEEKLMRDLGFPKIEAVFLRSTLQGIALEYCLSPEDYPLKEIKKLLINKYQRKKS